MRWLPWRRKQTPPDIVQRSGGVAVAERPVRAATLPRTPIEPHGTALTFARDALMLSGTRVQVVDSDLLAVTLPDGSEVHYTGSLARARGEADATLLVQGGTALGMLLDDVALHGARTAFALPSRGDPAALALAAVAEPAAGCGKCAYGEGAESAALCEKCPLRAGRYSLAGLGGVTGAREIQRSRSLAVELTYLVTYRDHDGRSDESHRLAYDAETGEPVAPMNLDALADCMPLSVPASLDSVPIVQRARADLGHALEAGGALLALRATTEYQRRLHDLRLTHERLLRESPEAHAELEASHAAERERLADLFAVSVEAELASVTYITTTLAEVAVRHAGGELTLKVDLGRGVALPPQCGLCEEPARSGRLCTQGHVVCASCGGHAQECPLCGGAARARGAGGQSRRAPRHVAASASEALTVERLTDLSDALWQAFVAWYLGAEGYVIEAADVQRGLPLWSLHVDAEGSEEGGAAPTCAVALRPPLGRYLGAADVRAALNVCQKAGPMPKVALVTPAPADAGALAEAAASGVRLVDRDALAAFLGRMAAAHTSALADAAREAETRALAAIETQRAILDALTAVEREIAASANSRRATGRGPLAAATNTVTAALREAERALLAWETLVTDWLACFDERPAPDGSLHIARAPDELRALAERAEHLRVALGRPVAALSSTPGTGESGYTGWRKALLEQLTTACEALSWRASTVNPAQWRVAASARDANAASHAESTAQVAKHTAARAAKARDLLAARIGL